MQFQPRTKGLILVITGSILWGTSATAAQFLFQDKGFSSEWLVVIRLLVTGILLLLYSFKKDRESMLKIWNSKKDRGDLISYAILGILGLQYSYLSAIKYGNAATATILQYLAPAIITCYFSIRSRKLPSLKDSIAIAIAMLGTFFIITKGDIHTISISKLALFWGLAAAFALSFYTLKPKSLLNSYDSTLIIGWGMLIGGLAFSFIHQPWNFVGEWSITSVIALVYVVLFGTLAAFYCYLESLKYISATEASILSSFEPLSAAFLSVTWLHVPFGLSELLGTACILITVVILSKREKQENPENFTEELAKDV